MESSFESDVAADGPAAGYKFEWRPDYVRRLFVDAEVPGGSTAHAERQEHRRREAGENQLAALVHVVPFGIATQWRFAVSESAWVPAHVFELPSRIGASGGKYFGVKPPFAGRA